MPVIEKHTKNYFSISKEHHPDGLVRHKDRDGLEHFFGGIEGILVGIELVKDEYEGEVNFKYHFKFEDAEHTQVDILQIGESASAARGLLTTLVCSAEPIGWVSVSPYRKEVDGKTYTNVWVEVNGHTVDWKDEVVEAVPETKEVQVGAKTMIDDSARCQFFRRIAKNITQKRLHGGVYGDHVPDAGAENVDPNTGEVTPSGADQADQLYGPAKTESGKQQAPPEQDPPGEGPSHTPPEQVNMDGWDETDDGLPF